MNKSKPPANGSKRTFNGKSCVYYDGYWIRRYDSFGVDSLKDKKSIIDLLTRRVFHHVEQGINTPGYRLEQIREMYEAETCPNRKRVKGAMLAGALLNRGRDILTHIVELEDSGVTVRKDNELFEMCDALFTEALERGQHVKLALGGDEGSDELWGEPIKAFSLPLEDFYHSRYLKLAQTMKQIDFLGDLMRKIIGKTPMFKPVRPLLEEFCKYAKEACETLRIDPEIFEIWPRFTVAKEDYEQFRVEFPKSASSADLSRYARAEALLRKGGHLLTQLAVMRVTLPKSVKKYTEKTEVFFLMK